MKGGLCASRPDSGNSQVSSVEVFDGICFAGMLGSDWILNAGSSGF